MSRPHDFQRETAPNAYLKRVFIQPRPNQITFAAMIGTYRIFVLDLSSHYRSLKMGEGGLFIIKAIKSDADGVHRIRGTVSHYILVVDDKPIALYNTKGNYIGEPVDDSLPPCLSWIKT